MVEPMSVLHPFADSPIHVVDADQVTEAASLLADFGEHAALEAAIRAGRMRDIGNHVHFCRWRQTERLIELLEREEATGTVH